MPTRFKILAIAAALAAGTSSAAMAQYACPQGYTYYNGTCQPVPGYRPVPGYPAGPLAGAQAGAARGAAQGNAAAGPIGGVVGGAIGTATGTIAGTANAIGRAVSPPPACAPGYAYYNGACYPRYPGR
jgi:hypothetical protein